MADVEIFDLVKYANENQPIDFAASLDKLLRPVKGNLNLCPDL